MKNKPRAKIIKAPNPLIIPNYSVFLAGSIEEGTAVKWRPGVESSLAKLDITILNPRRDEWSRDWVQDIENTEFRQQVNWELQALEIADRIVMYFDPRTKAPISLLELGLYAKSGKLIVCCPQTFWRKGNVDIVCKRYNVPQAETINDMIDQIKAWYVACNGGRRS